MKMKTRPFFFAFLLLTLLTITMAFNAHAADYALGISEDDELIWRITTADTSELEDLGYNTADDRYQEGSRMKIQIEKIDATHPDYWKIHIEYWDWTDQDFSGSGETKYGYIYKDPTDPWAFLFVLATPFVPTPVNSYLETAFDGTTIDVDDTTVSLGFTYYGENYKFSYTYRESDGVLEKFALTQSGTEIYAYELETFQIPGYELTILLGITLISTFGLIYLVMKKKK